MSVEERLENLEQQDNTFEPDTIIPEFQNPDTCVFCDDEYFDSSMCLFLRIYYHVRNGTDFEKKLDKETCIHHKDKWLKHSNRTAGFIWSAFTDRGNKPMTFNELLELFKNKEKSEKLLTEYYDKEKNVSCAMHLALTNWSETKEKHRYNKAFTVEDDIPIQNKILQNKLKTHYTNAIEVLQAYGDSLNP